MKSLAIFASGKGSNADNIINYLKGKKNIKVALIVSSHKDAGVLEIAKKHSIDSVVLDKKEYFGSGENIQKLLRKYHVDGIVLAGYIWLVPSYLIENYPGKIVNIHPALLPKYGGKGMYGMYVHEAVRKNNEKETGITIHQVNQKYDEGKIIFQTTCTVSASDTPYDIAQKVSALEYKFFPSVIEKYFTTPVF